MFITFQITNGGFTTEEDISPYDAYNTQPFDKINSRNKEAQSTNENQSPREYDDEEQHEEETEVEELDIDVILEVTREGEEGLAEADSAATSC